MQRKILGILQFQLLKFVEAFFRIKVGVIGYV